MSVFANHPRNHNEPSVWREISQDPRVRQTLLDAGVLLGGSYLLTRGVKLPKTRGGYREGSSVIRTMEKVPFHEALKKRGSRRIMKRAVKEALVRNLQPRKWRQMQIAAGQRRAWQQVARGMGGPTQPAWVKRKLSKVGVGPVSRAPEMTQAEYAAGLGRAHKKRKTYTPKP